MKRFHNTVFTISLFLFLSLATTGCLDMLDDVLEHDFEETDNTDSTDQAEENPYDDTGDTAETPVDDQAPTIDDYPAYPTAPTTPEPPAPEPEEDVIPDVDATLNNALIRIFIVGGSMSVTVEADWSATGANDLLVDLEVLSSMTYRAWTPILTNQSPVYFEATTISAVQGERRFDFRIVAHDSAGNEWISNSITVQ